MRYQSVVTDFAHQPALTELAPAARRLAAALARPRPIAVVCILSLTASGWLALGLMTADGLSWQALCRAAPPGGAAELLLAMPMWAAMTLAMMLPTAGPMILTYAEIADTAARKREPAVSPLILAAGYVAVWLGFAMIAGLLQWSLALSGMLAGGNASPPAAGAIFLAAGLYQFSALKRACLSLCQRPFPFFFANWTAERSGVLQLGLRQGLYCLGCCWAVMLIMFAVGTMNVVWMAGLGVLMTAEKMAAPAARLREATGVGFLALGLGTILVALGGAWI
jgi:predicted metal-binding membrane protein